jgi:exodeoxyribonuclease III
MKIATFNINNINRRLPNLLRWLRAAKPDVVTLQELKTPDDDFPVSAIKKAGYARSGAARKPGMASPSWRAMPIPC